MAKLPAFWQLDPIKYLVQEKYPELVTFASTTLRSFTPDFAERHRKAELEGAAFEARLQKKSPAQIAKLVEEARERDAAKQAKILADKEKALFYNTPDANADFDYWAKISYWRIDEAVALSFGKNPRVVNWERIKSHVYISKFAAQYAAKRELAERAKTANQISLTISPSTFLAWAKRTKFEMPTELEAAVSALGIQIADWKTLVDRQSLVFKDMQDKLATERAERLEEGKKYLSLLHAHRERSSELEQKYSNQLEKLNRRNAELQNRLDELGAAKPNKSAKDFPLRERDSLLKLVIGMALQGYRYDPKLKRSDIITEIQSDLEKSGVPLDDETIRKYLKEGAELLPGVAI